MKNNICAKSIKIFICHLCIFFRKVGPGIYCVYFVNTLYPRRVNKQFFVYHWSHTINPNQLRDFVTLLVAPHLVNHSEHNSIDFKLCVYVYRCLCDPLLTLNTKRQFYGSKNTRWGDIFTLFYFFIFHVRVS